MSPSIPNPMPAKNLTRYGRLAKSPAADNLNPKTYIHHKIRFKGIVIKIKKIYIPPRS